MMTAEKRNDAAMQLLSEVMCAMRGHEMIAVRLVLAMAFAESVKRSKEPNLPAALDTFSEDASAFYFREESK